jgi:hypothetical protein
LSVIALNLSEENKRVHEQVDALTNLSQFNEVFWTDKRKAASIVKFQDRVQQVHRFFDKCYAGLRMIWKTMFPFDSIPPTLLTLMSKFSNAEKVRTLVRSQLLAEAETAFFFVLSQCPSLDLESFAKADVDINQYFPAARDPASIVVARLEISSEANCAVQPRCLRNAPDLFVVNQTIAVDCFDNFVDDIRIFGCLGCKFIRVYDVTYLPNPEFFSFAFILLL